MEDHIYKKMAKVELYHWWYLHLHSIIIETLSKEAKRLNTSFSILDAGCGTGGLISKLQNRPFIKKILGSDPHPLSFKYAKERGILIKNYSIENLFKIKEKFDVILCIDVLYHKNVNPRRGINNLFKILKPGGILILNVAAMPSLKRTHGEECMEGRRFTDYQLRFLLESEGFKINDIFYWNSLLTPFLWILIKWQRFFAKDKLLNWRKRKGHEMNISSSIINNMLTMLLLFERKIQKLISFPFGSSLYVVAYKLKVK